MTFSRQSGHRELVLCFVVLKVFAGCAQEPPRKPAPISEASAPQENIAPLADSASVAQSAFVSSDAVAIDAAPVAASNRSEIEKLSDTIPARELQYRIAAARKNQTSQSLFGKPLVVTGEIEDFVVNLYDASLYEEEAKRRKPPQILLRGCVPSTSWDFRPVPVVCEFTETATWGGLRAGQVITVEGQLNALSSARPTLTNCRLTARGNAPQSGIEPAPQLDADSLTRRHQRRLKAVEQLKTIDNLVQPDYAKDGYKVSVSDHQLLLGSPPRLTPKVRSQMELLSPLDLQFGYEPVSQDLFADAQRIRGLQSLEFTLSPAMQIRLSQLSDSIERLKIHVEGDITPEHLDGINHARSLRQLLIYVSTSRGNLQIDASTIEQLSELPQLQDLEISQAFINNEALAAMGALTHLRSLNLSCSSEITGSGLGAWGDLKVLEQLSLSGSIMTSKALNEIPTLPMLRIVQLSQTGIDAEAAQWFKRQPQLERVRVSQTATDDELTATILQCPHLNHLNLESTEITDGFLDRVPMDTVLTLGYLSLANCTVTDSGLEKLLERSLPDLEFIDLQGLSFSPELLIKFAKLPNMQTIRISKGYEVSDKILQELKRVAPRLKLDFYLAFKF